MRKRLLVGVGITLVLIVSLLFLKSLGSVQVIKMNKITTGSRISSVSGRAADISEQSLSNFVHHS
ncbi:MAG: hypothetical protein AAGA18_04730 [Verrucomicrobiota bacterium]